ncbi:MAG: ASCH domain-containing protein [Eubacteriales bacterium]
MKTLSIKQPWAWAIIQGLKPVENRTWKTDFRGEILIHAGKTFDKKGFDFMKLMGIPCPDKFELKTGGIIGKVTISDCVNKLNSRWFKGPYGFILSNPKKILFIPVPGQLGFFDFDI